MYTLCIYKYTYHIWYVRIDFWSEYGECRQFTEVFIPWYQFQVFTNGWLQKDNVGQAIELNVWWRIVV